MDDRTHDEGVERLLRASRPEPDPEFVESVRRRLFGRHASERPAARRPLLVGAVATAGMACAALVAGLAGSGPLALSGQGSSRASDHCRFVRVERRERVPVVVTSRDGTQTLAFRTRSVERRVKRCS
jgi:hypothetical protein